MLDLNKAWDFYLHVFRRLEKQLLKISTVELKTASPQLLMCNKLKLVIPGSYSTGENNCFIDKFHPTLKVITSKQRPRRIKIFGSDHTAYNFLLKGREDLRLDERVMQLFKLVNANLNKDVRTRKNELSIHRYSVIPLSPRSGLITWVSHSDTLHQLLREYRTKMNIPIGLEFNSMRDISPDYENLPLINKIEIFLNTMEETDGMDLERILWLNSKNSEHWINRRTNYTRSLAVMSMVGYILGLGDRHPSNLMIERYTGKVIHIDFGDCFEVAMKRDRFPEKIPFRLTRMIVNAMEVTGIEGNFRITCERVMSVLRENKDSLMAVLEAFVHDPLINWRLLNDEGQQEEINEKALDVINRIALKLTGKDFEPNITYKVPQQVDKLIQQARSEENFASLYIGWCPFW